MGIRSTLICDQCPERAIIIISWWEKGVIDLTDLRKMNTQASCGGHFLVLVAAITKAINSIP
jgi:hypothetical protein